MEDGYTRTANALVEAFARSPLTSRESRVIRVIERMTYGWQKAEDWIAASVISDMTGMPEGKCSETLNALIRKKVVSRNGGGRSPVRINKNVSEWDFTAQRSRVTPKQKNKPEWSDSPQDGVFQSPQNGVAPKETKETTTADAVVGRKKTKRQPRIKWSLDKLPDGISAEVAEAYREHRKAKRAKMTNYALSLVIDKAARVANEAGISGDDVLNMAIEGGWTGLEVKWVRRVLSERSEQPSTAAPSIPACPHADLLKIWDETCGPIKGAAPNLLDWQGTKSADALAERWAEFYNAEINGRVRYDSVETGLAWWRMALSAIAAKQDFRSADIDIWSLFYKGRFGRAANGKLCGQGGATR